MVDYKLVLASNTNIDTLIQYKLASTLDYHIDISLEERDKIERFVCNNIPKDICNYKMIVLKDKIIGAVCLKNVKSSILIDELYLEENFRSKGIGTDILKNIISKYKCVFLWVYKNNEKALSLYKRLGFKVKEEDNLRVCMEYKDM